MPSSRSFRNLMRLASAVMLPALASAQVVINEILYHAPEELDDLQYIELHNAGTQAVDLSGWSLRKGVQFQFAAGTLLPPKGFLVVCRNTARFNEFYKVPVAGEFHAHLKHKGERLELADASGRLVDAVKFSNKSPWPLGPDGHSGSLERISPTAAGEDPSNWISSPLSDDREKPGGTPGIPNAGFSPVRPPVISAATLSTTFPAAKQPLTVDAEIPAGETVEKVEVLYRLAGPGTEKEAAPIPMTRAALGRYTATIPGQPAGQLLRVQVRATGPQGSHREFPASTEPHPALSAYVPMAFTPAKIPFGWIVRTTEKELKSAQQAANRPMFGGFFPPPDPEQEDRDAARERLIQRLDVSALWFEVGVRLAGDDIKLVTQLRELVAAQLGRRSKTINDFLAPGVADRLPTLTKVADAFLDQFIADLRRALPTPQQAAFDTWLKARTDRAAAGEGIVTSRVDLEGLWQALTINTEPDTARLPQWIATRRSLDAKRAAIAAEIATGADKASLFRPQRDRADDLGSTVESTFKNLVSPGQASQLDFWSHAPRPVVLGFFGPAPGGGGAGPGRGPRGPGGPGGPGFMMFGGPPGFGGPFGGTPSEPGTFRSAFAYFDPATGKTELFDFVKITGRKGGQKVHFQKDQPLGTMSTIALIFEGEEESLVEYLAYEVYRRAAMPVEQSYPVRLWQDGKPAGYSLLIEQPNRAFLRRNRIDDNGDMFKLLWFGGDLVGQHERHTHKQLGHTNLIAVVEGLEKTTGDAQWAFIEKNFDVNEVATYFAVNMVLSHWDGFFNNYFAYQDTGDTGKWMMFPWDQDSTWGLRAMGQDDGGGVFTSMPLTFGMNGDNPGGGGWWRAPGFFSGPLLANPQFRKVFLAKTKSILETVYSEKAFGPFLDGVAERMIPEIRARAEAHGEDPADAVARWKESLVRCREHLKRRRAFLLAQDELKKLR